MSRIKYLSIGIICFLLGGALIQPAVAHVITSKDAHTLSGHHIDYFASRDWTKKYFLQKSSASNIYLSKASAASVYLSNTHALATFLTIANASSTYLTISNATLNYLTKTDAGTTYLAISDAAADYLSKTDAGTTYLTQANAGSTYLALVDATNNYLTIAGGSSTYLSQASASSTYLTQSNAASTYLSQSNANSTYLTQANAASTYLTQSNASSTYLTQTNAANTYLAKSGGTMSGGLTTPSYSFSSPNTYVMMIPGTEFKSAMPDATFAYSSGEAIYKTSGTSPNAALAPVMLPNGAKITEVKSYYFDSDPTYNLAIDLLSYDLSTFNAPSVIASVNSSGNSGLGSTATPVSNYTIDYTNFFYNLRALFNVNNGNNTLKAVKITYTLSSL